MSCGQQIKLEREADNSGWNKFNLDGSTHVDEKKQKFNTAGAAKVAELAKKVETLESKIDTLIAQIQMLRSELRSKK
jgi:hypothetical protein